MVKSLEQEVHEVTINGKKVYLSPKEFNVYLDLCVVDYGPQPRPNYEPVYHLRWPMNNSRDRKNILRRFIEKNKGLGVLDIRCLSQMSSEVTGKYFEYYDKKYGPLFWTDASHP